MKELLLTLLEEFRNKLDKFDGSLPRHSHFPEARNKIKVAIGMRRTGKTTFVYQYINKLLASRVLRSRILYINFEDDRLLPMSQKQLAQLLDSFYAIYPENHDQLCYFFLDEIQNVEDWPLVIRRFFDSKHLDIYLTGSSSKLLSKEIATSLRGRSLSTEIWPYSFEEYLEAKAIKFDTNRLGKASLDKLRKFFMEYLNNGGFPEILDYTEVTRAQALQEYVQVVTLRDIIERHNITNHTLIRYLIKHLLNNAGTSFSINKIFNDLKSQGFALSRDTLYDYLSYIEDAYLAFSVSLYSESFRKSHVNPRKIYAVDTGLVKAYSLSFSENLGRMFENIIYLDLRRRGYHIQYYLTEERYEVDFVATSPTNDVQLLQVVWNADDQKTLDREQRALDAAMKELKIPGKIITLNGYLQGILE